MMLKLFVSLGHDLQLELRCNSPLLVIPWESCQILAGYSYNRFMADNSLVNALMPC